MDNTLFADRFSGYHGNGPAGSDAVLAYHDGHLFSARDAKVSVWDHGFLYGDGALEGIRLYSGGIFKLDEHLDRLDDTCHMLGIQNPLTREEMRTVICTVCAQGNLVDGHIRPMVTRGVGEPGLDPRRSPVASVVVLAYPMEPTLGTNPVRLTVSSVQRKAPHSIDSRMKSLNYLDSVLAKLQANAGGFDDALMLDSSGMVAEATAMTVFIVRDGALITPPVHAALPGITRQTILDMAAEQGWPARITPLTIGDLMTADEMFLCGTGAEVVPVETIDDRRIGDVGPGPLTSKVSAVYKDLVQTAHRTEVREFAHI